MMWSSGSLIGGEAMAETGEQLHHVTVRLVRGYQFETTFDDLPGSPGLSFDERAPIGEGRGPDATDVFSAALGNCLAASLAFCLRKAHAHVGGIEAHVTTRVSRNRAGRLRITGVEVTLTPDVPGGDAGRLVRSGDLFEDFCTVTASVRAGIPVSVTVTPPERE
jgi:organic hydroperoxide reductase OsmC/OhrA